MMQKKIIPKEHLESCLEIGLTRVQIAERLNCSLPTLDRNMKENGLEYLKSTYFNRGCNNPVKRLDVREKISMSVETLWKEGYYEHRVNGMIDKTKFNHPRYTGHKWSYAEYLGQYQDISKCTHCGCAIDSKKIDIHHIDGNHDNWLITNLEPVCVECHKKMHVSCYKTPFVTIGVKSHFDSSHNLIDYDGKCARNHGHRYCYEVKIRKRINRDTGMVEDFKLVKEKVSRSFEEVVDHTYLNDILPFNTTAENMVVWMFEFLTKRLLIKGLIEVTLWETPEHQVTVTDKDMIQLFFDCKTEDFLGGDTE